MKKIITSLLLLFSPVLNADSVFHASGSNLSSGPISQVPSLLAEMNNPASGAVSTHFGRKTFGFGLLSSFGVSAEVGQVDNFLGDLDRLADQLDRDDLTYDQANNLINEFQVLLVKMGDVGYVTTNAAVHAPLFPMVMKAFGGALVFDINGSAQVRLRVLDSPLAFDQISSSLETNTSLYIKGASVIEGSVGYSRRLFDTPFGKLFTGVRAKYFSVGLTKSVVGLTESGNTNDELGDRVGKDFATSNAIGVDVGLMLVSNHFSVGATVNNINQPSFNYAPVGQNCASLTGGRQNDCYSALSFANEINLNETHVFALQTRLESSFYSAGRSWMLSASMDVNPVNDPVGNELQWLTGSATLAPNSWFWPGMRLGYRSNLVGSQLSYATAGLTLFKIFSLDMAYGLESVQIEGDTLPRGVAVNLGLELSF